MKIEEMLERVDHTLLNATSSWAEICALCEEAIQYRMASVCVPPSYVARIHNTYGGRVKICTVIGFPLGYCEEEAKVTEALHAVRDGAEEIDMVIDLGDVKNGDYDKITNQIAKIKKAAGDRVLKVIVETCFLTEEEKIKLCRCVTDGGADFIKTSTGFGPAGAKLEDIRLFKQHIGPGVKIKAAGGISSLEQMEEFLRAGCDRIGSSGAVKIMQAAKSCAKE